RARRGRCDRRGRRRTRARVAPALRARARIELLGLLRIAEAAPPDVRHLDVGPRALLARCGERRLLLADLEHGLPAGARLEQAAQLAQRAAQLGLERDGLGVGRDRSVDVLEAVLADLGEAHEQLGALTGLALQRGRRA